jgi:hypothetical protein
MELDSNLKSTLKLHFHASQWISIIMDTNTQAPKTNPNPKSRLEVDEREKISRIAKMYYSAVCYTLLVDIIISTAMAASCKLAKQLIS